MSINYNIVPASQIQPVSSVQHTISMSQFRGEAEDFFLKKGINSYKAFKNACSMAAGSNKSQQDFLNSFLRVLEEVLLQDQPQGEVEANKKLLIKTNFSTIKNCITVMLNSDIKFDETIFCAALAGFFANKIK